MTIAIAGISKKGIITVTDSMISTQSFSADRSAFKLIPLHPDWRALLAGNDLARVIPMCRRVTQYLDEQVGDEPCGFLTVEDGLRQAWNIELKERIEQKFLNRYRMSIDDFVREGEKHFGSQYQAMKHQIDATTLGFDLLVSGYDSIKAPHLISIGDFGDITHHTSYKFWAIGNGAPAALSHFFSYGGSVFEDEHESVLYRCVASKFAAETAPGVGRSTLVAILNANGTLSTSAHGAEKLRSLWQRYGVPSIPQACLDASKALLDQALSIPTRTEPRPPEPQSVADQYGSESEAG